MTIIFSTQRSWMGLVVLVSIQACFLISLSSRVFALGAGSARRCTNSISPSESQESSAAAKRQALHRVLDRAKDENSGIHDACIRLQDVGDLSSVPHLIHALRFFGEAEFPLPPGVGIVCTQGHCVAALERI